ncbi:hypothetical protein WA026_008847 [Henosepilachna vigintioctopunctata]|uniref:Uncharacterized protein n=1 Tax=Henosepilachna vigintioctopunctata TaxID=420089 RepID=A0AAW1VDJ0_9CUCU
MKMESCAEKRKLSLQTTSNEFDLYQYGLCCLGSEFSWQTEQWAPTMGILSRTKHPPTQKACDSSVGDRCSLNKYAGPPVQQPNSDDIQESLPNTETEGKPNKNEEPKSQETKKPMNTKSDADHHKNKISNSEKIVSNHEADETKDQSTPQLQRIVLFQQYKLNKIKLEKETLLLETMKNQTVEKSTQNHRAAQAFVSQFEYNQGHQLQTANENVSATKL